MANWKKKFASKVIWLKITTVLKKVLKSASAFLTMLREYNLFVYNQKSTVAIASMILDYERVRVRCLASIRE